MYILCLFGHFFPSVLFLLIFLVNYHCHLHRSFSLSISVSLCLSFSLSVSLSLSLSLFISLSLSISLPLSSSISFHVLASELLMLSWYVANPKPLPASNLCQKKQALFMYVCMHSSYYADAIFLPCKITNITLWVTITHLVYFPIKNDVYIACIGTAVAIASEIWWQQWMLVYCVLFQVWDKAYHVPYECL